MGLVGKQRAGEVLGSKHADVVLDNKLVDEVLGNKHADAVLGSIGQPIESLHGHELEELDSMHVALGNKLVDAVHKLVVELGDSTLLVPEHSKGQLEHNSLGHNDCQTMNNHLPLPSKATK